MLDNNKPKIERNLHVVDDASLTGPVDEFFLYNELRAVKSIDSLKLCVLKLLNELGFSDYSFMRPQLATDRREHLSTLPSDLQDEYYGAGLIKYDLVMEYAADNAAPIYESVIDEYVANAPFVSQTIRKNRELFRLLKRFGYYEAYVIPVCLEDKVAKGVGTVALSVRSKNESLPVVQSKVEKNKPMLHLLAEAVIELGANKFPDFFVVTVDEVEEIDIRPKPLRLLTVLATEDLTLNEAADKLCMSIHTANQHIAAARQAFGARTTFGAIHKARISGFIKP